MEREVKVKEIHLTAFTNVAGSRRGMLEVRLDNGKTLPVTSASVSGERSGTASYRAQKDAAVRMAANHKCPFIEVDEDKIKEVLSERRKKATDPQLS